MSMHTNAHKHKWMIRTQQLDENNRLKCNAHNDNRSTEIFNPKKNKTKRTILDWGEKNGNSFTRLRSRQNQQRREETTVFVHELVDKVNQFTCLLFPFSFRSLLPLHFVSFAATNFNWLQWFHDFILRMLLNARHSNACAYVRVCGISNCLRTSCVSAQRACMACNR